MENAPAVIQNQLEQLRNTLPVEKQLSWLQLCSAKQHYVSELEKKELALQQLLIGFETFDILKLQTAIEDYKNIVKDMPEYRKGYTRYLDKIYDELSAPEKRALSYDKLGLAVERFKQLRLDAEKAIAQGKAKVLEAEQFKTHVKNEYARLSAEYKSALLKTITDAYVMLLNVEELTKEGLKTFFETTEACLADIKIGSPAKFSYTLNSKEEITALLPSVTRPDFNAIFEGSKTFMKDKFSLINQDRANKVAAEEFAKKQNEEAQVKLKQDLQNVTAVNNLTTEASITQITSSNGIKELKRTTSIVVCDDSPEWAAKIVATFSLNWSKASQFVRIKKWGNLSVSQMAAALDAAEIKVDGVEYKQEVK